MAPRFPSILALGVILLIDFADSFLTPNLLDRTRPALPVRSACRARGPRFTAVAAPERQTSAQGWESFFPCPPEAEFGGNVGIRIKVEKMLRKAQLHVCNSVEQVDGEGKFTEDIWSRPDGGGGLTRVMTGGKVWEKAGCNLAVVHGTMPAEALLAANDQLQRNEHGSVGDFKPGDKIKFFACGLSSVMHPKNPHCPTMHFNYRYFETEGGLWWFGGGTDITPVYVEPEDMKHFHGTYKEVCDRHDPEYYGKFKKWADEYFLIKHREETRGLGGIFFENLCDKSPEAILDFCEEAAMAVPDAYLPVVSRHKNRAFTQEEKDWQLIRRGRYVEFNLVYDRGTIFGLKTGGRTESILMTLPKETRWLYDHHPAPGTREADAMDAFKHPREWV